MNIGPYLLDNIYCGDSALMLAALPDACVDLTVTSPPYDNLRSYNGYSWDFDAIAMQLYRVTKPGGVVVWVVGDATVNGSETGSSFRQALGFMEIGFNLHDTMIWNKGTFTSPQSTRYPGVFEYMFILSRGPAGTCNQIKDRANATPGKKSGYTIRQPNGEMKPMYANGQHKITADIGVRFNVWEMPPEQSNTVRTAHSAQFPEALARDHVLSWSNPGDIVLDPFAGSGTTAKMSKMLSRHWLGFDISQEYVDLANRRVAGANVPLPLFVEQPVKPTQLTII